MKEITRSVSKEISDLVKSAQGSVLRVGGRHPMPSSGVVWSDDGVVVTTGHLHERTGLELGMPDFSTHPASPVGTDPATGISVVRIEGGAASELAVPMWADPVSLGAGQVDPGFPRNPRRPRGSLDHAGRREDRPIYPAGHRALAGLWRRAAGRHGGALHRNQQRASA
jgi:hypothetical protein